MALRSRAGGPHIEVGKVGDLPAAIPGPACPEPERDASGRVLPGPGTVALARKGGLAKAESQQLQALLGLDTLPPEHPMASYVRLGREFRNAHLGELAAIAGGRVGAGPASILSSAALQMAASRALFDVGTRHADPALLAQASKLADSSRQNLLCAFELATREAKARPQPTARERVEARLAALEPKP